MGQLYDVYGPAKHPERPVARERGALDDATVAALGSLSEALEVVEVARGLLYQFHRMSGTADLTLQEAVGKLRAAGHDALADEVEQVLVGRDVVPGRWTFQLVDAYDEHYWQAFRAAEAHVRDSLAGGTHHLLEAEMKRDEQGGASPSA